jgi:hypothetical protein
MRKTGVTLLEVLFAIAISAIGILGVLGTLVIAGKQAGDGARMDGADRIGRNAVREMVIRKLDTPAGKSGRWSAVPINGHAYCLDPLGVAANAVTSETAAFPAHDPVIVPGPRMHRVSLRSMPGDQFASPSQPIGLAFAESIFVARDDLVFGLDPDRTLLPKGYETTTTERAYVGAFSWFATYQSDNYYGGPAVVSIVVCHRRDPSDLSQERLLTVEKIDSENPTAPPPTNAGQRGVVWKLSLRPGRPEIDWIVGKGEWVLIAGLHNGRTVFQWNLVQDVSDVLPANQADAEGHASVVDTKFITTFGRDWLLQPAETQIALFGYVVAVYEKTIRCNYERP